MVAAVGTLNVNIRARTAAFGRDMGKARAKVTGFAASVGAAAKQMAAFAGVTSVGLGFVKLIRLSEDFNRAMNKSMAIMGDLTDQMRGDMKNAALEVSRTTVFSAKEAADAYFFLASAGLSAEASLAALPTVAQFAQAGMFSLSQATDLLTDAQSALGLTVDDATENLRNMIRVGDVLVKANTLANASVEQFSTALTTKAGAALKIINKEIEEGVAVLAAFADQGIKGSDAGTALNIVLRDLGTKFVRNKQKFLEAGISVFKVSGEMENMADIVEDLEMRLGGMNAEQKKTELLALGFADKSVIFIQTLIGMSEKIREYEREAKKAGGTMQDVAGKQMTALQKATEALAASFEVLGDKLGPTIEKLARFIGLAAKIGGTETGGVMGKILSESTPVGQALNRIDEFTDAFVNTDNSRGSFREPTGGRTMEEVLEREREAFKSAVGNIAKGKDPLTPLQRFEQEVAADKAKEAAEIWEKTVDGAFEFRESLRTPFEVAKNLLANVQRQSGVFTAMGSDDLAAQVMSRGLEQLRNRFLPARGAGTDGAQTARNLKVGSVEAVRAVIRASIGGGQTDIASQSLQEETRSREALEELLQIERRNDVPPIVATISPA